MKDSMIIDAGSFVHFKAIDIQLPLKRAIYGFLLLLVYYRNTCCCLVVSSISMRMIQIGACIFRQDDVIKDFRLMDAKSFPIIFP